MDIQAKVRLATLNLKLLNLQLKFNNLWINCITDIGGLSRMLFAQLKQLVPLPQLASQFGKSDASIGNSRSSHYDSISSFKGLQISTDVLNKLF